MVAGGAGGGYLGVGCGPAGHIPVLLTSVLDMLAPRDGETIVDGTFGAGGYSRAILNAADCQVIGIDQDPEALTRAETFKTDFPDRFSFAAGRFSQMRHLVESLGHDKVDGVVLDIGVSSFQLDDAARGFSFMQDGPLDMRMSKDGLSAADVVNSFKEADIARILFALGEEKRARAIARAICKARDEQVFETTLQLAELIGGVIGRPPGSKTHPATRSFQALRIYVNSELEELALALAASEQLLRPGGRLVVVSFHSLEDRIAKQFLMKRASPAPRPSRHLPDTGEADSFQPSFKLLNKKPIEANREEQADNPRARSARLRAALRLDAPALPFDMSELKLPKTPEVNPGPG